MKWAPLNPSISRTEDGDQKMEYCFRPVSQDAATIMDECEADLQDQEPSTVCPIEDAFSDQVDNLFDQSFGDIFCSDLKEGVKEDKGKAFDLFDGDVFNYAFYGNSKSGIRIDLFCLTL